MRVENLFNDEEDVLKLKTIEKEKLLVLSCAS